MASKSMSRNEEVALQTMSQSVITIPLVGIEFLNAAATHRKLVSHSCTLIVSRRWKPASTCSSSSRYFYG